jgi:hypothetical protein
LNSDWIPYIFVIPNSSKETTAIIWTDLKNLRLYDKKKSIDIIIIIETFIIIGTIFKAILFGLEKTRTLSRYPKFSKTRKVFAMANTNNKEKITEKYLFVLSEKKR